LTPGDHDDGALAGGPGGGTGATSGLDWNLDLPSGVRALEYEVAIDVELQFVARTA
jgi:hypothetical protein